MGNGTHKWITHKFPRPSQPAPHSQPPRVHTNLIIEEVNGVSIELEGECLEEGYIVGQNLLIREIQLQNY